MAEGEHEGAASEHEGAGGAPREQGGASREQEGVEREHINETSVSGGAKRRGLSQRTVTCC